MNLDALLLREVSEGTWLDFASGAPGAKRERSPVIDCWRRSRSLGASIEGPSSEEHLLRGDALKVHVESTELVEHVAAVDLERAASDVSPRSYVLLLADASGVVVRSTGGGHFSDEARRVRLIPGASWSESTRGTNAIGTVIAERRPVFVRGSAHFARRFHDLVCYAAPIFDADGSLVAVLDATSTFSCADDSIGAAVVRTAGAIMQTLRDRAFGRAGIAVKEALAHVFDRVDGAALLVEPPGRVTRMSQGAKSLFAGRAGQTPMQLFGADMPSLVSEARAPSGLTVRIDGHSCAVRVDPIETFDGHLIALLVFLERRSTARGGLRSRPPPAPVQGAFGHVFSRDPKLDAALAWAERIADSTVPVLLLAETGTGKELVARAIHAASKRAAAPFVAVNCGAIAPSLLESELFGHGPSSFTGADRAGRHGLFAAAASGTVFLDEVAEMPLPMQAALLRILEDGTFRRVGETTLRHTDVRVLSATSKDLRAMVPAGTFRQDLFYRLKGAEVTLPPLRARTDRAALAAHLLEDLARARGCTEVPSLSPETLAIFDRHTWPGNVRELRSVLEVALIVGDGLRSIEPDHLPPELRLGGDGADGASPPSASDLAVAEKSTVHRVLAEVGGNVSRAAKRLGVARSTLYRMIRRHGLLS